MGPGRRDGDDLLIELRVQPRAARDEFAGRHGERLRVRLRAPPVDGRANAALVEFIAGAFGLPRSRVVIEHGLAGRDKRLRLHGVPPLPPELRELVGCA